ncbi:unnamed protein product [Adineta ricciae]|uniref:nucleoside-diphosphate kinase n=1 Tax=Adineta ricciae TaxID=249248 RepID=A0A813MC95_ADIRI|nr:unnamed protein product [Adineta ricciae]
MNFFTIVFSCIFMLTIKDSIYTYPLTVSTNLANLSPSQIDQLCSYVSQLPQKQKPTSKTMTSTEKRFAMPFPDMNRFLSTSHKIHHNHHNEPLTKSGTETSGSKKHDFHAYLCSITKDSEEMTNFISVFIKEHGEPPAFNLFESCEEVSKRDLSQYEKKDEISAAIRINELSQFCLNRPQTRFSKRWKHSSNRIHIQLKWILISSEDEQSKIFEKKNYKRDRSDDQHVCGRIYFSEESEKIMFGLIVLLITLTLITHSCCDPSTANVYVDEQQEQCSQQSNDDTSCTDGDGKTFCKIFDQLTSSNLHSEKMADANERSFIMIKPDGVQRGLVGDILRRFEQRGYKLVALKMIQAPRALLESHYEEHKGKKFYEPLLSYIGSGPVVAMVWEGLNVITVGRKMLGATDPAKSEPGTIRGDYAIVTGRNIVHGSDSDKAAKREIDLWFRPDEIANWPHTAERWIYE